MERKNDGVQYRWKVVPIGGDSNRRISELFTAHNISVSAGERELGGVVDSKGEPRGAYEIPRSFVGIIIETYWEDSTLKVKLFSQRGNDPPRDVSFMLKRKRRMKKPVIAVPS